ncbi:MAG: ATP-binding cassette domain-containing protein [Candidatus Binatia bacterium]
MPPTIRLEQICVTKRGRPVLTDVTLTFAPGGMYSILGPSGAGKTTLLRLLNRLEDPTSGALRLDDTPYPQVSPVVLRRRVAMVFQVPVVFTGSVQDNLLMPQRLQQPYDGDVATLRRRLELAGLDATFLDRDAARLSVGEKQRVCMARALMTEPEVLLLDEPTAALDPTAARRLIESVADLNRQVGLTVIMVSHQPGQARAVGGQVVLLVGGGVAERNSAAEFFSAPATENGRSYLNGTLRGDLP